MKKKIIELVLENCQVLQFNPEDVYVEFEIVGGSIWKGVDAVRIKNVYICIDKEAKAVNVDFEDEDWKERIKIPDITHIDYNGVSYSIWEYKGEWENEWQTLTETDDEFIIEIRKKQ